MPKEREYSHHDEEESLPPSRAEQAFFRYQYTLGSYEYARRHGHPLDALVLHSELAARYDQYRALHEHPESGYTVPGSSASEPAQQLHFLRERPPDGREAAILARLEQAVGEIQDSETFRRYLDVQSRFHRYSWGNALAILAQRPDATQVAGYRAWQRLNRFVKRGERAIQIIVPLHKKVVDDDGMERVFLTGFGTGNVFDVSQTDGEPLPQVEVPILYGEEGVELFWQLTALAHREGIHVEPVEQLDRPTSMGDYDPARREIRLRQASGRQMVKTLAHELAHHFAGHTRSDPESETAAEAIAYVVCSHFGLDTGERSFPYIATWAKDKKVLQAALGTIQRVGATIIDGIEQREADVEILPPIAGGAPVRVYRGYSEDSGSAMGPEAVFVEDDDGRVAKLKHEVHHSPDGFSWGYGGSGPADLARSLLADHLAYIPSPAIYQAFKWEYVARWESGRPWQITAEQIETLLAQPPMQALLREQQEDERLRREIEELERLEAEGAGQP